ncbi:transcription initiation factor IIE subunit beta-like [Teleopsis dalmanni]|uniref:transcription initiation factor IIE subunit beta-like n=1 Tax=Teleopsis dalmanni TaxID=139649 RepID=UPI0018CEEEEB|nr:transcription initiation factor IIE subunit beta-like [Teleopsis dalmanni]
MSTSKKVPNAGGNANQYSASNNRSLESKYWQEWGSYVSKYYDNILTKIVKHMQDRYRGGINLKLSLQEILTETDQLDIDNSVMEWLASEALVKHPKIDISADKKKFSFKPTYNVRDGNSLMHLLMWHRTKGLGGVLLDDVKESLPNINMVLRAYAKYIIIVTRPIEKKKFLFFNDRFADDMSVDEGIQKMWRRMNNDGIENLQTDTNVEEAGISCLGGSIQKTHAEMKRKTPAKTYQWKKRVVNGHVQDILETYKDDTIDEKVMELENIPTG